MLLVSLLGRAAGLFIVVVIEDVGVRHLFNVLLLQPVFHGVELLRELAEKLDQSLRLLLYRHLFLLLVVGLLLRVQSTGASVVIRLVVTLHR